MVSGQWSLVTEGVTDVSFIDWDQIPTNEVAPGVRIRAPYGENLMLSLLEMDEGAVVNRHHHPHEQGGILLEGRMELSIGDDTRMVEPGEAYLIPPNLPHRAVAIGGPAKVLDIFSPIREDYVDLANSYIPPDDKAASD
jgi:quercetin dioxygenase-like cupin family protein